LILINADIYTQHYGIKMLLNRKLFQLLGPEHKDCHNYLCIIWRSRKRRRKITKIARECKYHISIIFKLFTFFMHWPATMTHLWF